MSGQGFLLSTVILLTLLVGAAIPALYQLYQTFKRARALLDSAGPRLETTLAHMNEAVDRLDSIGSILESRAKGASSGSRSGEWFRRAAVFGSAFAPAAFAGARALLAKGNGRR